MGPGDPRLARLVQRGGLSAALAADGGADDVDAPRGQGAKEGLTSGFLTLPDEFPVELEPGALFIDNPLGDTDIDNAALLIDAVVE